MNKNYLIIVILLILLTSCDPYGVNKDRDFQIIRNQLSENLKVNSIEIKDNENLLIKVKSPFNENNGSFENFASVAQYIIGKNYKPNVLNMEKNVIIEMTDKFNNNYKSKTDIKSIFYLEKYFDRTLKNLEGILSVDYNGEKSAITEFHKTECFKKITNDGIESANIIAIKKKELGKVEVTIIADSKEEQYIRVYYTNNNLDKIKCLKK